MLLERITLDAIGRPLLSAGEAQQAELDQVGQLAAALFVYWFDTQPRVGLHLYRPNFSLTTLVPCIQMVKRDYRTRR